MENGRGVTQDYAEAVRCCRKAADQGLAEAQCCLGGLYTEGRGMAQNDVEAVRWFEEAASQGNAGAQYCSGMMLASGRGVAKNATLRQRGGYKRRLAKGFNRHTLLGDDV